MLGTISRIEEVLDLGFGKELVLEWSKKGVFHLGFTHLKFDGYRVTTDKHTFYVLIENGQECCESWGYLSSGDDIQQFVDAELLEINLTDKALNQKTADAVKSYELENEVQFVDFVTSKGTLQFAVYNGHNGSYGHDILVLKDADLVFINTL